MSLFFSLFVSFYLSACMYICLYVCLSVSLSLYLCLSVWPYIIILTCPSLLKYIFSPPSLSSSLPSFSPSIQKLVLSLEICLHSAPPSIAPLNSSSTSQDDAVPYASVSRCVNWCLLPWRLIQFVSICCTVCVHNVAVSIGCLLLWQLIWFYVLNVRIGVWCTCNHAYCI